MKPFVAVGLKPRLNPQMYLGRVRRSKRANSPASFSLQVPTSGHPTRQERAGDFGLEGQDVRQENLPSNDDGRIGEDTAKKNVQRILSPYESGVKKGQSRYHDKDEETAKENKGNISSIVLRVVGGCCHFVRSRTERELRRCWELTVSGKKR